MTTEAAFLSDIVEHHDDDAPRLIFADWLEDHGRSPQAEFIRVQCELARTDTGDPRAVELRCRAHALESRYGKGWLSRDLRRGISGWSFGRGLVDSVTCSVPSLVRFGYTLFERLPVRHLRLNNLEELDGNTRLPDLRRLEGLDLSGSLDQCHGRGGLLRLAEAVDFSRLRSLRLDTNGLTTRVWSFLAERLSAERLEQLRLGHGYHGAFVRLRSVLASPAARQLRVLEVRGDGFGNALATLCGTPQSGQLRELSVFGQTLDLRPQPELPALRRGAFRQLTDLLFGRGGSSGSGPSSNLNELLSGLRRLSLIECRASGAASLDKFLSLPALAGLHTLELTSFQSSVSLSPEVLTQPHFAGLTTLSLAGLPVGSQGFAALTRSPTLSRLASLNLAGTRLNASAVRWLVESPHLRQLRWLNLAMNPIGGGLAALLESDLLPRLCWLDLSGTKLDDQAALAFAERAAELTGLAYLGLRHNALSSEACDRLQRAFGPTVRFHRPPPRPAA